MQGQLAGEIAKEVRVALTPLQQGRLAARAAVDPAVYDLYLRGRHAWNLRTDAGFNAAATYFEEAIRRDPNFALAHAGLADVYAIPGGPREAGESSESRAKAIAATTKAPEWMVRGNAASRARTQPAARAGAENARDSAVTAGGVAEVVKTGDAGPQPASADLMAVVGLAHLRSGVTAQADAILKTLRSRSPLPVMALSLWYSAIGDRDQAMAMLTRGTTPGAFPPSVAVDPLYDPLRVDARFVSLLSRNLL